MHDHPINVEEYLKQLALFEGLAPEEITRIARSTQQIYAEKGEILFQKGDPCNGFHILVKGQIKLGFTSSQGNEKVVEVVHPGQSFGEALMFTEKPYIVFAQTLHPSHLLHVSKTVIFREIDGDPRISRKMLASMAMRLHQLMTDVEAYSLQSAKQRIIGYLIRELHESQLNATDVVLELPVTKGVIASRLNLTQEHFSRILHDLTERGLILVEGKSIRIPNVANLNKHQL